jgi:hypothetical protein
LGWQNGRWRSNLDFTYYGLIKRLNNGVEYKQPPVLVTNLSGGVELGAGWSAALGINNVFDKRTRKVPEYARSATDVASIETTWDSDVLGNVVRTGTGGSVTGSEVQDAVEHGSTLQKRRRLDHRMEGAVTSSALKVVALVVTDQLRDVAHVAAGAASAGVAAAAGARQRGAGGAGADRAFTGPVVVAR